MTTDTRVYNKDARRRRVYNKMLAALRAVEEDAKGCKPSKRVKITSATMGKVQAALNDAEDLAAPTEDDK